MTSRRDGRRAGALSWLLVAAQFTGIGLALWPWQAPGEWPRLALLPCLAGLVLGAWTLAHNRIGNFSVFPEPRRHARLVTSGPYALVRHPMYGALILGVAGVAGWLGHLLNGAGVALVIVAVTAKALREERLLRERFPEYDRYRERTRRFVPYLL